MSDVKEHRLKTLAAFWSDLESGAKPFEVRRDDRNFSVGDILVLRWVPGDIQPHSRVFAERLLRFKVTYILRGGQFGIEPGFCVMGITPNPQRPPEVTP